MLFEFQLFSTTRFMDTWLSSHCDWTWHTGFINHRWTLPVSTLKSAPIPCKIDKYTEPQNMPPIFSVRGQKSVFSPVQVPNLENGGRSYQEGYLMFKKKKKKNCPKPTRGTWTANKSMAVLTSKKGKRRKKKVIVIKLWKVTHFFVITSQETGTSNTVL